MALKSILTTQEDFTGEFPVTSKTQAMWRINEPTVNPIPSGGLNLADSSGRDRTLFFNRASGTTAAILSGNYGNYARLNTSNPTSEQSKLTATNDGTFFTNLGKRIVIGGRFAPTTYSLSGFVPIFSTRNGTGNPIIYLSLNSGNWRTMLYPNGTTAILDSTTPAASMPFTLVNSQWYFFATVIDLVQSTAQTILGRVSDGAVGVLPLLTFTGTLNPSCVADIHYGWLNSGATNYWFTGSFDELFFGTDSDHTIDSLKEYFLNSQLANGGAYSANVDALTEAGVVTLKKNGTTYPESGVLYTKAIDCALGGSGRVSVTSEYTAGETAIASIETSTSDDLISWSAWTFIGDSGELNSPNKRYIRYKVTLTTNDSSKTPKLLEIQLHDIPKAPYEKLGFARPVVLDRNGAWEAVLENAFDIMVTSEINGSDILEFKLPFHDEKRSALDNEKQVQIVDDIYRLRTVSDEKGSDGKVVTQVYAEAAFYDLAFSEDKQPIEFNAETAENPLRYALQNTGWNLGKVTVTTKRTWQSSEKNALAILRMTQDIHGGDLVFDSTNRLVHLLTFSGVDSGALFAYKKNMKSIRRVVDTRGLVTRLYAYGKDGMTFASINGGKSYVEDLTYTNEVRVSTLDCSSFSNPYQMLEFANMRLADYSKPRISYVLSAMDLSVLTGYEHEAWKLGDIVNVDDRDLGISIKTRIIRRQYNLQEPWKTVLELSTKLRELGDASSQWDKAADTLSSVDVLDRQEVKDLVPFNHLLNSRADDGFAYWQNSGFEVDTSSGVSGTACFKATGVSGMTKSLSQTVYPATRRNYTFSAQIASENLKKGANGHVGIEVAIEYEDGSTEIRFIDLF